MSDLVDFERVVVPFSARCWRTSSSIRAQIFHGVGRCWQRHDPFSGARIRSFCAECSEFHQQHLLVVQKRIAAMAEKQDVDPSTLGITDTLLELWAMDARNELDAHAGRHVNLTKLPNAAWFERICEDPLDQQLAIALLFFVRSADTDGGSEAFPVERWAERHGCSVVEVRSRIVRFITTVSEQRPDWAQRNLFGPMSERLTMSSTVDVTERQTLLGFEDDDNVAFPDVG